MPDSLKLRGPYARYPRIDAAVADGCCWCRCWRKEAKGGGHDGGGHGTALSMQSAEEPVTTQQTRGTLGSGEGQGNAKRRCKWKERRKERTAEVVDKANTERRGKQRYDMETPVKRRKRKERPSAKQDQANI